MVLNDSNLDRLISIAATNCSEQDLQAFNKTDVSDVVFDRRFKRKKYKVIRNYNHPKRYKLSKRIILGVIICLAIIISLGIMTVIATDAWNDSGFGAEVNEYDDHFVINFKPSNGNTYNTVIETDSVGEETLPSYDETENGIIPDIETSVEDSSDISEETTAQPLLNDIIKKEKTPTWVPEGMIVDSYFSNQAYVIIDYYNCDNLDEFCFSYFQTPIANEDIYVDNENSTILDISINGYSGVLITYAGETRMNMFWSDDEYIYIINSEALTMEEIYKIAESVQ